MKRFSPLLRLIYLLCIAGVLTLLSCNEETTKPPPIVDEEPEDTTTTSHFSTVFYDTLGVAWSALGGVAIINKDSAWVGGTMFVLDSTGKIDQTNYYNAAHWNSTRWQLEKITFSYPQIDGSYYRTHRVGIGSINRVGDEIWFRGAGVTRLRNGKFEEMKVPFDVIIGVSGKMSVLSPNDILFVGGGTIVHWDGQNFTKMKTPDRGKYTPLSNIYYVSKTEAYAVGGDFSSGEGIVIKYDGASWTTMIESNFLLTPEDSTRFMKTLLFGPLSCVWKDEKGKLYVGGNLISTMHRNIWSLPQTIPGNNLLRIPDVMGFVETIDGQGFNDIIIAGDYGFILHFNGKSWERIGIGYQKGSHLLWYGVHIKNDFAVAVGRISGKAILMRAYR